MNTYATKDAASRAAIKHFGDLMAMHEQGYSVVVLLGGRWAIARA